MPPKIESTPETLPAAARRANSAAESNAVAFLFAPGAGAPSASAWMQAFRRHLLRLGRVEGFDYAYQLRGRRSPDPLQVLIAAHRHALEHLRADHQGPLVLVGKSMGGRVGCHLAVELGESAPAALVCLGYPLVGTRGAVRDQVLLELRTPVFFVQGSRDPLCPLERLEQVRAKMRAHSDLYRVEGGDHSLHLNQAQIRSSGQSEDQVFEGAVNAIDAFLRSTLG
jgi:predicted alpha/beta-hydrolase family hydrolase